MNCVGSYKSVAFGSAGILVCDDNGLQDLPKLLEVLPHGLLLGFPCESTNENLGVGCVSKLPHHTRWAHDSSNLEPTNLISSDKQQGQQLRI